MSTYTHDDAIKHFQDLILATTRLSFPLFSENEEKQSYLLKCKNNLDLDFDNILNNLHPIFNLSSTKRESIWKKSFKNAEKKFNYTTSYKLNSFFLQKIITLHIIQKIQSNHLLLPQLHPLQKQTLELFQVGLVSVTMVMSINLTKRKNSTHFRDMVLLLKEQIIYTINFLVTMQKF